MDAVSATAPKPRWFDGKWCAQYIGNSDCVCDLPEAHQTPCRCTCHPMRGNSKSPWVYRERDDRG
jgi:hypothetical protein